MRDDRKREHREIRRGVGAQTSGRRHEQRGKKEMPIKGEKRKASRDKKKKKEETWKMEGKIRVTDSAENCLNETRTGRNLVWS